VKQTFYIWFHSSKKWLGQEGAVEQLRRAREFDSMSEARRVIAVHGWSADVHTLDSALKMLVQDLFPAMHMRTSTGLTCRAALRMFLQTQDGEMVEGVHRRLDHVITRLQEFLHKL
jgi:hypothetical protein